MPHILATGRSYRNATIDDPKLHLQHAESLCLPLLPRFDHHTVIKIRFREDCRRRPYTDFWKRERERTAGRIPDPNAIRIVSKTDLYVVNAQAQLRLLLRTAWRKTRLVPNRSD